MGRSRIKVSRAQLHVQQQSMINQGLRAVDQVQSSPNPKYLSAPRAHQGHDTPIQAENNYLCKLSNSRKLNTVLFMTWTGFWTIRTSCFQPRVPTGSGTWRTWLSERLNLNQMASVEGCRQAESITRPLALRSSRSLQAKPNWDCRAMEPRKEPSRPTSKHKEAIITHDRLWLPC